MLYELYESDRRHKKEVEKFKENYQSLNISYIDNLNKRFKIREYQKECFARLEYEVIEWQEYGENMPLHLFFNLATGAGKTLIMAENILYLYEQGYRNFIFLVHQNAILDKTRDNFLNKKSNKYLFAQDIIFNSKKIYIKEVETFTSTNTDDINIIFTTCAGLHDNITNPRENKLSLASLKDKNIPIVLLADEAHHLLADTKDGITDIERKSWQNTVKNVLLNMCDRNILLEYSATIDLSSENIKDEYNDKIIMKYGLKEFREDGYSKDIFLFKSDLDKNTRILSALIMSLYRQSVVEYCSTKNSPKILHFDNGFKPVVFVKSSDTTASKADLESFKEFLPKITGNDIETILKSDDEKIKKAKKWLLSKNSYEQIAENIKAEFGYFDETVRIINSKSSNDDKKVEILRELNSLDSKNNNVRIIFAVQMLTEGWDVLCLYDIVRLDEGEKNNPKTVTSDIQLIGRGCRYNPFYVNTDIDKKYTRKYDYELEEDLRCLEELYYYSKNDSKYIKNLKEGLIKEGLQINDNNEKTFVEKLKTNPETKNRWKNRLVYENVLEERSDEDRKTLSDYKVKENQPAKLSTKTTLSSSSAYNVKEDTQDNYCTKIITFEDKTILRKAMDLNFFYDFNNLVRIFPYMKTKEELFKILQKEIKINLTLPDNMETIERKDLLNIYSSVLKNIEKTIKANNYSKKGSNIFKSKYLSSCLEDYPRTIKITPQSDTTDGIDINDVMDDKLRVKIKDEDWYAYENFYGNSLEKAVIRHISDKIKDKTYPFDKCENLLLVRNHASICKLYDFNSDKGFEPDFLLFFTRYKEQMNYMLFIESKGEHLKGEDNDKWKEDFMLSIENKAEIVGNDSGANNYKIIGLKFFTEENNEFPDSMKEMFARNNIQ